MKKREILIWSLIAALCLMVVIAGLVLLKSYNSNKANQKSKIETEVEMAALKDELAEVKAIAADMEAQMETQTASYLQKMQEMQTALDSTAVDRDALTEQVGALTETADQAVRAAETLQGRYDTALSALRIQKSRVEDMTAEIDELKSKLAGANVSSDEQKALQDELDKAQAELIAAQEEKEALIKQAKALEEELNAAKAGAAEEKEALDQTIASLTGVAAQAAQDAEALQAKYHSAQTDLEILTKQNEEKTAEINSLKSKQTENEKLLADNQAAFQEALTKAQAELAALQEEKERLAASVAALTEQAAGQQGALAEQLKALMEELDAAKAGAAEEKEALNQTIASLTGQLDAAAEQIASLTDAAALSAKDTEKLQTKYNSARKALEILKKQNAEKTAEIDRLKSIQTEDEKLLADNQTAFQEALTKAQAELSAMQEEKEKLMVSVAALTEQAAGKQGALTEQLKALKEELDAAKASAAEQIAALTDAAALAVKDTEKLQTKYNSAQKALELLRKQSIEKAAEIDSLKSKQAENEKLLADNQTAFQEALTKAQAELSAMQEEKEKLTVSVASLTEQAAGQQGALTAVTEELNTAKAAAAEEKEALDQAVASLNDQLDAAQKALESTRTSKETMEKANAILKNQLSGAQKDLDAANEEKKALDQTVVSLQSQLDSAKAEADNQASSLNDQLSKAQADLAAAGQENEELAAAAAALSEELAQAKSAAADRAEALNAELNAALEELSQTRAMLASTTSAMEQAGEEAAASIAALEEDKQRLSGEAADLRQSLEAETQKSAQLQEELDVQTAQPAALLNSVEAALALEGDQREARLTALADIILRAFRDSIPADAADENTNPVAVSVRMEDREIVSAAYDLTKAQEARAYEAAAEANESQNLYQVDLNHENSAMLVINGTAIRKKAYYSVYAEVFAHNPGADQATLNQMIVDELVKKQVIREHAEALGLDPDASDAENRLWETVLESVEVSDRVFKAALQEKQVQEKEILASDPKEYAEMLEEGKIVSSALPEGSRFVKQLIVPVDFSLLEELQLELDAAQKELSKINEIVNSNAMGRYPKDEVNRMNEERDILARQVSQLTNDRKRLLNAEKAVLEQAEDLARQLKAQPDQFDAIAAQAQTDEAMPAGGYAVFHGAVNPSDEFVAAALALKKQGDVSEPIKMADGYHILYYSEEITGNSAAIQANQDALHRELLEKFRVSTQEKLLKQWIGEANVINNVK